MNGLIYERLKSAIIGNDTITPEEARTLLSPLFRDSLAMSKTLIDVLQEMPAVYDDESGLPQKLDTYAENFHITLLIALENGMHPNELVPHEEDGSDNEAEGDHIMWAVIGHIRHSKHSPAIIKSLLEHGGDPNARLDSFTTVFTAVDDFFWLDGENLNEPLLKCWLLMAAYGGDKENIDFLPLKPLNGHQVEELKDCDRFTFSFETVGSHIYKRDRVLFIVDKLTGEKVAVNETPFG